MSDKELLELAAKAHGGVLFHRFMNYPILQTGKEKDGDPVVKWDPFNDDGDALRLAAKLRMNIVNRTVDVDVSHGNVSASEYVPTYANRETATRRAIVRAAAEIGKALP